LRVEEEAERPRKPRRKPRKASLAIQLGFMVRVRVKGIGDEFRVQGLGFV